ncbi:hypothetical protein X759_06725 [Mesorhizobium sp. LSHC420B00]|nr:hypothetical protein X759_06725 [Mesorhizobium sp. LSHC420B00]
MHLVVIISIQSLAALAKVRQRSMEINDRGAGSLGYVFHNASVFPNRVCSGIVWVFLPIIGVYEENRGSGCLCEDDQCTKVRTKRVWWIVRNVLRISTSIASTSNNVPDIRGRQILPSFEPTRKPAT